MKQENKAIKEGTCVSTFDILTEWFGEMQVSQEVWETGRERGLRDVYFGN